MCDPSEIIQNDLHKFTLPDVVRSAGGFAFLAVGVALEVVLHLLHGAGSVQHQRLSAVRAEHQT